MVPDFHRYTFGLSLQLAMLFLQTWMAHCLGLLEVDLGKDEMI